MLEYEQRVAVAAPANEVFAWVSDVENLPKYLPPIKEAGIEGSAAEGSPGERVKMLVEIPDRGEFESEGYFDVDAEARTMRWGAEAGRDYSGRLTVAEAGDGRSEVTVYLSFGRGRWRVRSRKTRPRTATRSKSRWGPPWSPSGARSRKGAAS